MFLYRLATRSPCLKRVVAWLVSIVLLSVARIDSAVAQTAPTFTLDPFIQVSEMFDDNVALTANGHHKDLVTNALLGCKLSFTSDGQRAELNVLTALQKFAEHPQLDDFGNTDIARFNDEIRLTPSTTARVDNSFVRASASSGLLTGMDPTLSPQFAVAILSNAQSVSNFVDATLTHQSSELWSTLIRINQSFFESSTTGSSFIQGLSLAEEYRATAEAHLGVSYEFDDMRFSRFSGSEVHFPRIYLDWTPMATLKLEVEAGPILFQGSHGAVSADPGFRIAGKYSLRRLELEIRGGQAPSTAAAFGGAGLVMSAAGSISYALSRRAALTAGTGFYQFTGNRLDAQVLSYGIGASYKVNRAVSIFAQAWRVRQSGGALVGSSPTSTSSANVGTVGIVVSFEAIRGTL